MKFSDLLQNPNFVRRLTDILLKQKMDEGEHRDLVSSIERMETDPTNFSLCEQRETYMRIIDTGRLLAEIDAKRKRIRTSAASWGSAANITSRVEQFEAGTMTRHDFYSGQGASSLRNLQMNGLRIDIAWHGDPPPVPRIPRASFGHFTGV